VYANTALSRRRPSLIESRILAFLCLADMIVTLWVVESGMAMEANPIMRFYYDISPLAFACAKTLTFVGPILILEQLYDRNPRFIRALLRGALALYVAIYVGAVFVVN
jgi:hypothetical protein